MYKVTYMLEDYVLSKEFEKFDSAALFSIKQPVDSILEIKYYDNNQQRKPDRT
jgi:hypothetical protein